jgi:hypothetical protein
VVSPRYPRIRDLHALVHKTAAETLSLAASGNRTRARIAPGFGGEFAKTFVRFPDELERWRSDVGRS